MAKAFKIELKLDEAGVQALHRALYRDNSGIRDLEDANDVLFNKVNRLRMKNGIKTRLESLNSGCK